MHPSWGVLTLSVYAGLAASGGLMTARWVRQEPAVDLFGDVLMILLATLFGPLVVAGVAVCWAARGLAWALGYRP